MGKRTCWYFDGGTCLNEEAFPGGIPTEIGEDSCSNCPFYMSSLVTTKGGANGAINETT